ncbi:Retinaldehyde-binding protein 1 [Orchesella cincta]|uniref:Retinaldehyde-binding protein 1 n=1 Tax=Orchesella cincta TaxID=48709 RepID=A0A1D2M9C7_ORCCI|nr:Retinaldehyde-binding protein 1 [Orchesella cincta]
MEVLTREERDGMVELKGLIKGFLNGGEGSKQIREYITSVSENDALLLIFLKGRKCRVNHAWETLKRNAVVRFNEYPESFPVAVPECTYLLLKNGVFGILKTRDNLGRRIMFLNGGKWEPSEVSLEDISAVGTHLMDKLLLDEDVMNNGLVSVIDCEGMGMKHLKEYSLNGMLRLINIFCYAYPIPFKGFYFANAPFYCRYIYKILTPFLPKKLKERILISASDKQFEMIHENISPQLLPKFLGGVQENETAFDRDIIKPLYS